MNTELHFRLLFLTIFFASLMISGFYRRRARRSGDVIARRQEGGAVMLVRMAGALLLLSSILLYVLQPGWLVWAAFPVPYWLRWLAAGVGIACIPLLWWLFHSIGVNISETILTKRNHRLVTDGPYRWVRHPLYAVALLEILILGLLAGNWFILLLWAILLLIFRLVVIPAEERNLIQVFGVEYEKYRARTGALFFAF